MPVFKIHVFGSLSHPPPPTPHIHPIMGTLEGWLGKGTLPMSRLQELN